MNLFEPVNLIQGFLNGSDEYFYLLDTKEDINNLAELVICELISNEDAEIRTRCIDVLAKVNSKVLDNQEKFNFIIELIEWHTYVKNQPGLVNLQIHAQNALTIIQ